MFLANAIQDFAFATKTARDRRDKILKRRFATAATRAGMQDLAQKFLDRRISLTEEVPGIARLLPSAVRLQVSAAVAKAWEKMDKIAPETRYKAFPFARLPSNPTWIEYPKPSNPKEVQGYFLREVGEGSDRKIIATHVMTSEGTNYIPMSSQGNKFIISATETITTRPSLTSAWNSSDKGKAWLDTQGCSILSILLLLNSRSKILKIGEPQAESTEKSLRAQFKGKSLLDLRPIEFDISRFFKPGTDAPASEADAEAMRQQQLVIGHFKVRQTGVFWWSPHWRNLDEDVPRVIKDRVLVKGDGLGEQFTPSGHKLV